MLHSNWWTKLLELPQREILVWYSEKKSLKCLVLSVSIMTPKLFAQPGWAGSGVRTKRPVSCAVSGRRDFNVILRTNFVKQCHVV